MVDRAYNFSAGPCTLPLSVLQEAQSEFVNYQDTGMSLIEMSHRSPEYDAVHQAARAKALALWGAPDDFDVLFIQGGATEQFAMVPMNLLAGGKKAAYVHSGHWAKNSIVDAKAVGNIYTAWNGENENFMRMPSPDEIQLQDDTRYLHITSNETIGGVRYTEFPDLGVPLVADMSSEMLARPIPWDLFDVVYGGAQKNLGPAGVGIAFVRKSILEETKQNTDGNLPRYLRYDIHQAKESMYNTCPVFAIYMIGKVLNWMEAEGGLAEMQSRAAIRAQTVYDTIENSGGFYSSPVSVEHRSHMNVVFTLPSDDLQARFLAASVEQNMSGLKGHRSVGGCRASIYNAMPQTGVDALAELMSDFAAKNG